LLFELFKNFEHIAWMQRLTNREQIDFRNELNKNMFENSNQIGICFITKKNFYVNEKDCAKYGQRFKNNCH